MTNQEINEAVARKLGWKSRSQKYKETGNWATDWCPSEGHELGCEEPLDYCTSIAAAWEIVEKWDTIQFERTNGGRWILVVDRNEIDAEYADTAPMAICLAFLKRGSSNG
jgi:hypothetical protein